MTSTTSPARQKGKDKQGSHTVVQPRRWNVVFFLLGSLWWCILLFGAGCAPPGPEPDEELSGGSTTVFDITRKAFDNAARNLPKELQGDFFVGNSFFNSSWVQAPSSTAKRDGLGPLFNARSCTSCHSKDGRGRPPAPGEKMLSMLLRLSIPGKGPNGGPKPEPNYGLQLNPHAIQKVTPEGQAKITYEEIKGTYADGTPYTLRKPTYTFHDLAYPMSKDVLVSPRVAPAVFGLGLLEAITEADILKNADPDDADGDGISGRPNRVWDVKRQKVALGRFGWKANQPTIEQQTAGAFLGDIGITSTLFTQENCTPIQTDCQSAKNGGEPELPQLKVDQVTLYVRYLAVPGRRDWDKPQVLRGKQLFMEAGCASCHTPKFTTGDSPEHPAFANETIRPYTDLLLHDMGDGLADGRPDFQANGKEWRTTPLWGLGLIETVNRHTLLLHDGRARNIAEAILWHGGEGEASQKAFVNMPKEDREALLAFLNSL